mgnify:CR=1 FL=1
MPGREDEWWRYAQVGLELAAAVLLGFWAGWRLDLRLGTGPWLALSGAAAGLAAGGYLVLREILPGKDPR